MRIEILFPVLSLGGGQRAQLTQLTGQRLVGVGAAQRLESEEGPAPVVSGPHAVARGDGVRGAGLSGSLPRSIPAHAARQPTCNTRGALGTGTGTGTATRKIHNPQPGHCQTYYSKITSRATIMRVLEQVSK